MPNVSQWNKEGSNVSQSDPKDPIKHVLSYIQNLRSRKLIFRLRPMYWHGIPGTV